MKKFMKVMLSLVLVFSIATINLDASTKVTKYSNGNVKTRTYYNGSKRTKKIEYTSTGRKSMMYTFNSSGKVYTKYYYNTNGKQYRSYRYDTYGRKANAYDYKTVNGKRVIVKKWNYTASGKKSKYQQYYDSGKLKTSITYYSNGKTKTKFSLRTNGKYSQKVYYYSNGRTKQVIKYDSKGKVVSNKSYKNVVSSTVGNMNEYETKVFREINSWRKSQGLSTLSHSNRVHTAAEMEVKASSASNPHPGAYVAEVKKQFTKWGAIQGSCGSKPTNCSAKSYVNGWANSHGHRIAMESTNFKYMSVAYDGNDIQVIFAA